MEILHIRSNVPTYYWPGRDLSKPTWMTIRCRIIFLPQKLFFRVKKSKSLFSFPNFFWELCVFRGLRLLESNGGRGDRSRVGIANAYDFQEDTSIWEVPKGPIESQVETTQANPSSWKLPKLPSWWTQL